MAIAADIVIRADAARVWSVLVDFPRYRDWNPFIPEAEGEPRQGGRIAVLIRPPGQKGMRFKPTLVTVEPMQRLVWRGSVLAPGVFDGVHTFELHPEGDGVRFRQSEDFSGFLAPLLTSRRFLSAAEEGFQRMNDALRRRCETSS